MDSQTKQTNKMFLLISMLTGTVLSVCNNVQLEGEILLEYHISKGVFQTLTTTGLTACQRACMERSRCKSVGYNRKTLSCSLGKFIDDKVFTGNKTDVYFEPDWNKALPESLGPCRSRQCSKTEKCVVLLSGSHSCITELKSVDLTVLMDVSWQINETDFHSMVNCVQHLIGQLHDVRLAVVFFGGIAKVQFGLNEFLNNSAQIKALEGLSFVHLSGRKIAKALNKTHSAIYNGSLGDRPEVQDVILVILHPDNMFTLYLSESVATVKSDGIHIITVGRTPLDDGYEVLNMTASEPLDESILTVSDFSDLSDIETQIVKAIKLGL